MDAIAPSTQASPVHSSTRTEESDTGDGRTDHPGGASARDNSLGGSDALINSTSATTIVDEREWRTERPFCTSSSPSAHTACPKASSDIHRSALDAPIHKGASTQREGGGDGLFPLLYAGDSIGARDCNGNSHADEGGNRTPSDGHLHDAVDSEACGQTDPRPEAALVERESSDGMGCNNDDGCAQACRSAYSKIQLLLRGCNESASNQIRALHTGGSSHDSRGQHPPQDDQGWTKSHLHRLPVRPGGPFGRDPSAERRKSQRGRYGSVVNQRCSLAGSGRPQRDGATRRSPLASVFTAVWDGAGSDAGGARSGYEFSATSEQAEEQTEASRRDSPLPYTCDLRAAGESSRYSVPGGVGGIPSHVRGVEMQRTGGSVGIASPDMGARECIEEHACTPRLAQLHGRHIAVTSGGSCSSASSQQRYSCRREDCATALRTAKARAKAAEKELRKELDNRRNEIIGALRNADVESGRVKEELTTLKAEMKELKWYRNSVEVLARKLSNENSELVEALSAEKSLVLSLRAQHAAQQKQAALKSRRASHAARASHARLSSDMQQCLKEGAHQLSIREKGIEERERELAEREDGVHARELEARRELTRVERRERESERKASKVLVRTRALRQRLAAEACARSEKAEVRARVKSARADMRAKKAEQQRAQAEERAVEARKQAEEQSQMARDSEKALATSEWAAKLTARREERAKAQISALSEKLKTVAPATCHRSPEEWASLKGWARYKAAQREVAHIKSFLTSHDWRAEDIAKALSEMDGLVQALFDTKPFFSIYFGRVGELMKRLELQHFGIEFGLMLHYDMRLTLPKIVQLTQAASKSFSKDRDLFAAKPMLWDPFHVDSYRSTSETTAMKYVPVPRIAPPVSKLLPVMRKLESMLGIEPAEDGRIAFKSFAVVVQEMLSRDPGTFDMPELPAYMGGKLEFPMIISFDGTGYGSQQFNTVAIRNPYHPHSALQLRIIGLGNCGDDRDGTTRVLADNLDTINSYINTTGCMVCTPEGSISPVSIKPHIYVVTDLAALRHTEHLANSGWCGCSRDFALRETPPARPESVTDMLTLLAQCVCPTRIDRYVWSHSLLPGEDVPRPCNAPGCKFAHDAATAASEYKALLAEEALYAADTSKKGKAAFSRYRMAHAHKHFNVQPGLYGKPMLEHDMKDQILDPLHYSKLGLGKTPWKHAVLNNASDDAREAISNQLKAWKHPLDCRRKDDNRQRAAKWFTGEAWTSFCAGHGGSPGAPIAIATIMMIIADDMQQRGVMCGSGEAAEVQATDAAGSTAPAPAVPKKTSTSRRDRFASSNASKAQGTDRARGGDLNASNAQQLEREPSRLEIEADQEELKIIREMFGSRAQTLINALLAWDAYLAWYYALEAMDCRLFDTQDRKEAAALKNCALAIDMHDMYERISVRYHKSFLPHGAIFKVTANILDVGDVKAFSTSALELQNAETKRTATSSGSRRLTTSTSGVVRSSHKTECGPVRLSATKGYSTTMVLSTLKHLMVTNVLRRGHGLYATPESRRKERLFGVSGKGRISLPSSGVKLEARMQAVDAKYMPANDSCLAAFIRLLAARAEDLSDDNIFL